MLGHELGGHVIHVLHSAKGTPATTLTVVHCVYNDGRGRMATTQQKRSHRIGFRATPEAENLIKAGAKVRGMNVSEFILESACTRAEQAIADQTTFKLTPSQWKAFTEALDRPPRPKPRLKCLLSER